MKEFQVIRTQYDAEYGRGVLYVLTNGDISLEETTGELSHIAEISIRRVFEYWEVGSLLDGLARGPTPAVAGLDEGPFIVSNIVGMLLGFAAGGSRGTQRRPAGQKPGW